MEAGKGGSPASENPHTSESDVGVIWDSGWKQGAAQRAEHPAAKAAATKR